MDQSALKSGGESSKRERVGERRKQRRERKGKEIWNVGATRRKENSSERSSGTASDQMRGMQEKAVQGHGGPKACTVAGTVMRKMQAMEPMQQPRQAMLQCKGDKCAQQEHQRCRSSVRATLCPVALTWAPQEMYFSSMDLCIMAGTILCP